jgi:hypothetical protein
MWSARPLMSKTEEREKAYPDSNKLYFKAVSMLGKQVLHFQQYSLHPPS